MSSEGIKAMSNILDNSSNISKEIRNEVYKLLGLNTQSEQLSQFVDECLERFEFNSQEVSFLERLRMIATEEVNRMNAQRQNNGQIDYDSFTSTLIERFKKNENPVISIDDDIRNLANQIVDRFPQSNVSREQLYNHFMGKKEQIIQMINAHNKNIVNALIKITPLLAKDLASQTIEQSNQENKSQNLAIDESIRTSYESNTPKEPTPMSTYVGVSSEEIRNLINQNQYYSILHGISKENVAKYSTFINSGYQMMINDYLVRASQAKNFEERHDSYFELYEIYQNFRDYLSLEESNQLREQLENMKAYLDEQRKATFDDIGVRYNTSEEKQSSSSMRR